MVKGLVPPAVAIQALTMDESAVRRCVEELPEELRAELALGPKTCSCNVCDVLVDPFTEADRPHAALLLAAFHANPPTPEAEWERCEMIYRAAGWSG